MIFSLSIAYLFVIKIQALYMINLYRAWFDLLTKKHINN